MIIQIYLKADKFLGLRNDDDDYEDDDEDFSEENSGKDSEQLVLIA